MNWLFLLCVISPDGNRDFYSILNIKHNVTLKEIERSFQKLSRKYHPDKNKDNPEALSLYNDVMDAYTVLRNEKKRRVYDLYGEPGVHVLETPPQNDPLAEFMPNQPQQSEVAIITRAGAPYKLLFPVPLLDFYQGREYPVGITRQTMCRCAESGYVCEKCDGIPSTREITQKLIVVERGTPEGTTILLEGIGDSDESVAPGNVLIEIVSIPDPNYSRIDHDLHTNVNITLHEAIFGFKRTLDFIDGSKYDVETNGPVSEDLTIRVKGKGLPIPLLPGEYGDVVVHTNILLPKDIDDPKYDEIRSII